MRFIFLLMLVAFQANSNDKTLLVAVNIGPPWAFYQQDQGIVGIDVDIIRHIATEIGCDVEFHLLAYNRLIADFKAGKYDIASPFAFATPQGYLTEPYLPFEDVAVSINDKQLTINTVDDLSGKRVIAFQGARSVLGEAFIRAIDGESYLEQAEREVQLRLLVNDRADVVIGERRLLTFIMNNRFPEKQLIIHPIFETRPYGAIIKDKQLQQKFDSELAAMKASGLYQAILARW